MSRREELELILSLLRKYNLPLSPILEYAIREKLEECPEEESLEQGVEPFINKVTHKNEQSFDIEEKENISQNKHLNTVSSTSNYTQDGDINLEDRKGKPWTSEEEELITLYYNQGKDFSFIAEKLYRTEIAIKARLAKLGLIEYKYEKESMNTDSVDSSDDISSQFSVKIGDMLKLFPSQLVGRVIKLRIDKKGNGKIVVQSDDGTIEETYDSKYLYQKVYPKKDDSSKTRSDKRERIKGYRVKETLEEVDSSKRTHVKASIGDWILWKPTEEVGKVIAFRDDELGIRKMLVRKKNGYEIEILDHPRDYDIIIDKQKVAIYEATTPPKTEVNLYKESNINIEKSRIGGVKVGDWLKSKLYMEKCKVIRIESIGPTLEKLIVAFKDGHQDWIIDNPEMYRIVEE